MSRSWIPLWSVIIGSVRCGGKNAAAEEEEEEEEEAAKRSDKLSELLKQPAAEWWENEDDDDDDDADEVKRKEKVLQGLKNVAKKLQLQQEEEEEEEEEEKWSCLLEVRRLTKYDPEARTTLALLGVIPPLVALLDHPIPTHHIPALYALLNLAITNHANKAAIVKAGAVHKMLKLVQSPNQAISEAVVANFLGLSALDSNKPIIGSSGAIPFLVQTLKDDVDGSSAQAQHDSLRTLYNLSISPSNVSPILETDLVPHLLIKLGDMDTASEERILSILGNLVSVAEGRKRISGVADAFPILIDVLNWTDSVGCQEKASYILMVMAHKSYGDRQAMIEAGIVSSLLELTLLGSLLAQKRASRILECLRLEKGKQVTAATVSASLILNHPNDSVLDEEEDEMMMMMSQENKAVKHLVQQSLHNNMKRMVKRANLPHDFVPSHHFKSLTSTSTSKSLPF